jgi:predicted amidohydrolase
VSVLRLALSQFGITAPATLEAFAAKVDGVLAEARGGGADLVVLPEYASMEVAACYPGTGDAARELVAVCAAAPALLAMFRAAARRHGVWLLPGTLPWQGAGGGVVNRAHLISPEGRVAVQDKACMTRFEAEIWGVRGGSREGGGQRVFATPWGLLGIAICYDVEFPTLVRAMVEAGAWLILAPSCTDSLHGFNRVRLSARARALENQCFVAVAPTVGLAPVLASVDENHGYAAVFGPVDRGFAADGIVARGVLDQPGLVFADLDAGVLDGVRADGAVRNHRDWPAHVAPCCVAEWGECV